MGLWSVALVSHVAEYLSRCKSDLLDSAGVISLHQSESVGQLFLVMMTLSVRQLGNNRIRREERKQMLNLLVTR